MNAWLPLAVVVLGTGSAALAQNIPVSEQLSPGADGMVVPTAPISTEEPSGLVTVESALQQADNVTGVVTATGNVRIRYPVKQVQATARQAQYFTKEERIVLRGDVDVVQNDGHALRADQVIYLLQEDRAVAIPVEGEQVYSQWTLKDPSPGTEP